jgi:RNA polymerase sigma-70 factor (sigma-E family)
MEEDFAAFYHARAHTLRNTAYLLCGDWDLAQDLTQTTFIKIYRSWQRLDRHDTLDQFARRVLLRAFLDERRRPWRREVATAPESPALDPGGFEERWPDERSQLRQALQRIPPRRRAVLVLRFWADLSVEQVADILGCSTGTVKSQTSDGLSDLRRVLGGSLDDMKRSIAGGQG